MEFFVKYHNRLIGGRDRKYIDNFVCFDINNVAKYFYSYLEKTYWHRCNDFPKVTPPFDYIWMEYQLPTVINNNGKIKNEPEYKNILSGAQIVKFKIEEKYRKDIIKNDYWGKSFLDSGIIEKASTENAELRESRLKSIDIPAKWLLQVNQFYTFYKKFMSSGTLFTYLDETGREIEGAADILLFDNHPFEMVKSSFYVYYYALSFMNCKNVEIVKKDIPAKVVKKRKKRNYPVVEFKLLKINPISKRYVSDYDREALDHNRFHICRGHFKDYTEKGLFGKYKGIYWWDQCFKGSKEKGVIEKEYVV